MKKLISLIIMMAVSTLLSFAQKSTIETVYLKDGSIIRGEIVEFVPNQYVKVKMENGSLIECPYDDVERISKKEPLKGDDLRYAERMNKSNKDTSAFVLKKGPCGFFYGGFLAGDHFGLKSTLIYGYRPLTKCFIGGGAGMTMAEEVSGADDHYAAPIFLDARFDLLDKKSSPFIEARAGAEIALEGESGFYGAVHMGCSARRLQICMGLETTTGSKYHDYRENGWDSYRAYNIVMNFGFSF